MNILCITSLSISIFLIQHENMLFYRYFYRRIAETINSLAKTPSIYTILPRRQQTAIIYNKKKYRYRHPSRHYSSHPLYTLTIFDSDNNPFAIISIAREELLNSRARVKYLAIGNRRALAARMHFPLPPPPSCTYTKAPRDGAQIKAAAKEKK